MMRSSTILMAFSLGVLGLAGCDGQVSPEARRLLASGEAALLQGDAAAAMRDLDAFLRDHSGSSLAGEAYCYRGRARLASGDRAGARVDFTQAAGLLQDKVLAAESLLALGGLAEEDGDLPAAERLTRQAVDKLDVGQRPSDEALYRLGCVLQKQGRWDEADTRFDRLIYVFPDSPQARGARKSLRCIAWTILAGVLPDRPSAVAAAGRLAGEQDLPVTVREVLQEGPEAPDPGPSRRGPQTQGAAPEAQRGPRLAFRVEVGRYATYDRALAALPLVRAKVAGAAVVQTR